MKDKIIQIQVDSESGMTGLSESGRVYDFIPGKFLRKNGNYIKNAEGHYIIDPKHKTYWKLLIESPDVKGGE